MDLLAEAARLADTNADNNIDNKEADSDVQHGQGQEQGLGLGVASEEEQVAYLRNLLEHQVMLFNKEEEQCAFLASMLLRSHFKNLTETSFYSAFRKKNV
jgi:hypothetical protein